MADPTSRSRSSSQRRRLVETEAQVVPIRRGRDGETLLGVRTRPGDGATDALARDLAARVRGEVRFDTASRALYSHDASNYRQPPLGVVVPVDASDVEAILEVCRDHGAPVVGRGAGTSLSGQTVNTAVVLEFSKRMDQVVDLDPIRRRVRVQPGCVLDHLLDRLRPHGLTFGPDPATHNYCTLGGMIGNDSCGIHSVLSENYGPGPRTAHHVERLEIVTYDGLRMQVGATSEEELGAIVRAGGRRGDIYARLRALRDRYADLIRARFSRIPRRVSGYSLDWLLPERGFHVARALVGTESTCVTVLEATLEVYPSRPERLLVVLGYPSVFEAGDHVPAIRAHRPVGLEGLDDRLVSYMRMRGMHPKNLELLPPGNGWLLVELGGQTREEVEAQCRRLVAALRREPSPPSIRVLADGDEAHRVWEIRESGLGATAFVPYQPDFWPGWEDSAVPPERVGVYLRELRALLDRHDLGCALYGHFGQGCIHTRIDFDLSTASGIECYRRFTDEAADLCLRYGGSLSGEHGDGQARGDLLVKQYGPELVDAFREFKAIWDPDDRMNPGKVLGGLSRADNLKQAIYHPPEPDTHLYLLQDDGEFRHAAMRCVGVGKCRRAGGGTMCPSFMVTHEEMHTTRGRARMLYEMMQGDVITDGWASEEVKESLDLCLSCKGCKGDCPVKVDIALYKAEFLSHYYQHHRRPRHAYAFGWIHRWAWLGSQVPWLANLVSQTPGLRRLAAWIGGIAPERGFPRFARRPFTREFRPRPPDLDRPSVILWPDTFNNHFIPRTLHAAVDVLEAAGYRVLVPRERLCCGRALYDYGMLPLARRLWEKTIRALAPHIDRGTPIVGMEPSCVAAFRDELPNLFPHDARARRLSEQTHTLAELLADSDRWDPPRVRRDHAVLHGHCHDKAVLEFDAERRLLERLGLDVEVLDSGCCGLAGSFGYEAEHYDLSMQIGERVLLPAARAADDDAILVADGFSCRSQIEHGARRTAFHAGEVVAGALIATGRLAEARPRRGQVAIPAARAMHARRSTGGGAMNELAKNNKDKVIDLLTERLTFERAGVKLYDAILDRMRRENDPQIKRMLGQMEEHRDQEKEHEEWLEEQIRALGGDAHGQTEMSKLVETESEGIEKVILDGDPELPHLFHALLTAELADNAGWDLLVTLADEADDDTAKRAFKKRLHEEEEHLIFCRKVMERFMRREVLGEAQPMPVQP